MEYAKPDPDHIKELEDIANRLRIHSINATTAAGSGNPASCSSIAEVIAVLFFHVMKYKIAKPKDRSSDRFILSKGHAAPILYAAWAEAGVFLVCNLVKLRKFDSNLEGHPTTRLPFIDVATGSLGQGLSVACGMAYIGKYFDNASYRVYCVVGDGEAAEGSMWEALNFASYYKLDNLCIIFDINRLGQSGPTSLQFNMITYYKRLEAFGVKTLAVDGHNVDQLCKAFFVASHIEGQPTAILAKTYKGKHFLDSENLVDCHDKVFGNLRARKVVEDIQNMLVHRESLVNYHPTRPVEDAPELKFPHFKLLTRYNLSDQVATREAYGTALVKISSGSDRIIVLDADTKDSTCSDKMEKMFPRQFIQCFLSEQNMVGVATGAAARDRAIPFVSTMAVFFTRAYDQIRMAGITGSNIKFVGSHCGVSIGPDGPSQMALEDIAMFRTIPGCTIFYPSDAVSCERAVQLAANIKGICYIRTTKEPTSVLYNNVEQFTVEKPIKILVCSENDRALVIGAGITIREILLATAELEKLYVNIRVMDLFVIKPMDAATIIENACFCEYRIIVVEDHYAAGGIGEAVMSAVSHELDLEVHQMAIMEIPRSGTPDELLETYGISSKHIVAQVLNLTRECTCTC